MKLTELKHAQKERIIFLDQCLIWRGQATRGDLKKRFSISTAQAALDFRTYLKLADDAPPRYDPVRKVYLAAENHKPLQDPDIQEVFETVLADQTKEVGSSLPRPHRQADPAIIARLYQVIGSKTAVSIRYISMSSGEQENQWIAPTHFMSDGESVYVRAYSFKHEEYRNYLPIRIEPESSFEEHLLESELPEDTDWDTLAIIWLRPKKSLTELQAAVVRREYGFSGELLRLEMRKPLEFFLDRRWNLDGEGARLEVAEREYSKRTEPAT